MNTVVITGANRGLGLEFCRQYLEKDYRVIATCRDKNKAESLNRLDCQQLTIAQLDILDQQSVSELGQSVSEKSIDLLINNAGVYGGSSQHLDGLELQQWLTTVQVNAMSPMFLTRTLLPQLKRSSDPKVAFLTSKMGSMGDNGSGGSYIYRSSKAALNACIKSFSVDYANAIKTVALHPGWVRTDMGGPNGLIEVEESVSGLIQVIDQLDFVNSGRFLDYQGKTIPW